MVFSSDPVQPEALNQLQAMTRAEEYVATLAGCSDCLQTTSHVLRQDAKDRLEHILAGTEASAGNQLQPDVGLWTHPDTSERDGP